MSLKVWHVTKDKTEHLTAQYPQSSFIDGLSSLDHSSIHVFTTGLNGDISLCPSKHSQAVACSTLAIKAKLPVVMNTQITYRRAGSRPSMEGNPKQLATENLPSRPTLQCEDRLAGAFKVNIFKEKCGGHTITDDALLVLSKTKSSKQARSPRIKSWLAFNSLSLLTSLSTFTKVCSCPRYPSKI